jgi:hypothetical protein
MITRGGRIARPPLDFLDLEIRSLMGEPSTSFESYPSVQTWYQGLREQSGVDPAGDPSRLKLLEEFCRFAELDPDEIIKACLLEKEGRETKISIKGRKRMAQMVADFQAAGEGLTSRQRANRGNTIRSFLIHNGILLQAGMQL